MTPSLLPDGACSDPESSPLKLDTLSALGSLHAGPVSDARGLEPRAGGARSHGACLTLSDHEHIRQFIQEFTFRGLLPHIEKNIRQLNDQVPAAPPSRPSPLAGPAHGGLLSPQLISRKGLSRSLFTATKKWFGGSKAPEKGVSEPKSTSGLL